MSDLHARCVNKRLAIAKQLLAQRLDDDNSLLNQGYCDAVLWQVHLAIIHHINDLVTSYHCPELLIDDSGFFDLKNKLKRNSEKVPALIEWKQLALQDNSWLGRLFNQIDGALLVDFMDTSKTHSAKADSNLITIVEENSESSFTFSIEKLQGVVDECYQLILQQREQQLEY